MQFLDIIIFAVIATVLVLRLRNVLGRRTGHEGRSELDPFRRGAGERQGEEKVPLPDARMRGTADEMPEGADGLTRIKLADPGFEEQRFVEGARSAFEMIISAFAAGDKERLRPLLAEEVFRDFAAAIDARQTAGHSLETNLVGVESSEIIEAELQGKIAFVTIKFVSEQVNVTRDSTGEVVEGDTSRVVRVTDIWTFARDTRSRDPNWALVATRSPH